MMNLLWDVGRHEDNKCFHVLNWQCLPFGLGSQAGNPVTDAYWDNVGNIDYWHSHALISDQTWENMKKECNFSDPDCCSKACDNLYTFAQTYELGQIDPYSIYTANCLITIGANSMRTQKSYLNVRPDNPVPLQSLMLLVSSCDALAVSLF